MEFSNYQEKVFCAALKHERESLAGFFYEIWESHGYLVMIPKTEDEENTIILGRVTVTKNRIFGSNPIIISELEERLK